MMTIVARAAAKRRGAELDDAALKKQEARWSRMFNSQSGAF